VLKHCVDKRRGAGATERNQDAQQENRNDDGYQVPLFILLYEDQEIS
jgi:hypothetical protein